MKGWVVEVVLPNTMGTHSSQVRCEECDDLIYVIDHGYLNKAEKKKRRIKRTKDSRNPEKRHNGQKKAPSYNKGVPG